MPDNALKQSLSWSISHAAAKRANDFSHTPAKGLPCRVTKIEKDILTVAFEGSNGVWNMPTRKISQAFSPYGRDPTQVGDKGYASPSDYYLGGINKVGGGQANWKQRGNLTPLVFHPISKAKSEERDYDQLTHAGGPTGVKILQTAKQPKDDEAKPPDQPSPHLMLAMRSWGYAARRAWLARPAPKMEPTPYADDDRSFMEIDKGGKIIHHSKTGKHAAIVDEDGKNVALKAPKESKVHLGGDGTEGEFLPVLLAGGIPSVNVFGRKS